MASKEAYHLVHCYSLVTSTSGEQWLCNHHTGEKKKVAGSDSNEHWVEELDADDHEELQFMHRAEESQYMCDMLSHAAYANVHDNKIWIRDTTLDQSWISQAAYSRLHTSWKVGLFSNGTLMHFALWRFHKPVRGQCWWWSLKCFSQHVLVPERKSLGKKLEVSRPVFERWSSWMRTMTTFSLPPLRQAIAYDRPSLTTEAANPDMPRVLDAPSVCTSGLVAMLTFMAFGSRQQGACLRESGRVRCKALLKALLFRAPVTALVIDTARGVELHESGIPTPPWPRSGHTTVTLLWDSELKIIGHECLAKILKPYSKYAMPGATLLQLLERLVALGRDHLQILRQVVWGIGACIEMHLQQEMQSSGDRRSSRGHLRPATACELSEHQRHLKVVEYWAAGREHFQPLTTFSFGLDASRVGFLSRQNVVFASEHNIAIWGPPQVLVQMNIGVC